MSGNTNFPTGLDTDSSLFDVADGVNTLQAAHHNNIKEAVKAMQLKIGIDNTLAPTTLDYRLGHPTDGHRHDGASGHGPQINPTTLLLPDGESVVGSRRFTQTIHRHGTSVVGSNVTTPAVIGRTARIENVSAVLRRGASGATAAYIVRIGPTNLYGASVGLGVRFAPGATRYGNASPNLGTYPSGTIITLDVEAVGSSAPGEDLSVILVFRE